MTLLEFVQIGVAIPGFVLTLGTGTLGLDLVCRDLAGRIAETGADLAENRGDFRVVKLIFERRHMPFVDSALDRKASRYAMQYDLDGRGCLAVDPFRSRQPRKHPGPALAGCLVASPASPAERRGGKEGGSTGR